jgi:hypothetical protein
MFDMHWMFTGYLTSFYATLGTYAALTIHSHPRPLHGLFACFVLIPALVAPLSAESVILAPDDWKTKICHAIDRGSLTRACAFYAGLVTGLGVLACFAMAWFATEFADRGGIAFLERHQGVVFWGSGLMLLFLVALAPILPGSWLATRAERDEDA